MSITWRRRPQRLAVAVTAVGAVLVGGLTYAGLDDSGAGHAPAQRERTGKQPSTSEADAITRAAGTGKRVEATALRTAYSTTWADPDGSLHRRIHASPIRAKVDGTWKSIDTTLARTEHGWSPKATNTRMVFSAGSHGDRSDRSSRSQVSRVELKAAGTGDDAPTAGSPLVTLSTGGHDMVMTWPDEIPEPVIDGSRALYPEIIPGVDLVLAADDGGFSQLLVIKNRAAADDPRLTRLTYGLSSPDLSFDLDPQSRILHAKDETGQDVAISPTPLMWDSAGHSAVTDGTVDSGPTPSAAEDDSTDDDAATGETPDADISPTESATADEPPAPADGERTDPFPETRPPATDEAPEPSDSVSSTPAQPTEPTPMPSHTGSATTLDLPGLNGPEPDSHGTLVGAALDGSTWTLTPSQKMLTDDTTVYPVFVDPSAEKHTNDWTTAYSLWPKAKFYNGKGFNSGTHEARVGFESDTWGTSRSFFTIDWDPRLKGAKVYSATLHARESYSWSCDGRVVEVYRTGAIDGDTSWSNQPKWYEELDSKDVAHGYRSSRCPDDYVSFDVKDAAVQAVDGGWDTLTLGLRAHNESDQFAWKKFQADGGDDPYVDLDYNRPPKEPTNLDMDPDLYCDTTADKDGKYVTVGKTAITLYASASDPDGNLSKIHFDLWPTGDADHPITHPDISVGDGGGSKARVHTDEIPASKFVTGKTYSWQARSIDKRGSSSTNAPKGDIPCRFTFDGTPPQSPKVISTDFPDADANHDGDTDDNGDSAWSSKKFGTAGSFSFKSSSDAVRFEYGFNGSYDQPPVTRKLTDSTTVTVSGVKPPEAGPNLLYVRAVDDAGNVSQPSKYFFYVTPRDSADAPGDVTGDKLPDLFVVDGNSDLRLYPSEATTDLTKGTGDLHISMPGAYRNNPDRDPNNSDEPKFSPLPTGYWKDALITHLGDSYHGDGVQDLIARLGGKLWLYPGDGYGAVNVDRRQEIYLPSTAPDPASYSQIVSAGDITADGNPDLFAITTDGQLWVFTGYEGGSYKAATRLASSAWADRDLVSVQDVTGDNVADLLYRTNLSGRLLLRTGKAATSGGGVDLSSLASAAASAGGADGEYAASGWYRSDIRLIRGTPDVNGDKIPDIWALMADGSARFYPGGRSAIGTPTTVIASGSWTYKQALG
ncbi:DNRLRE domain-containing protein [Streptomyces sp. NPDC048179]|uniref:DNRLRE domain-containing protein n=1 Tax=Streptomyces sp. NPDC048179 TaxID=3365506 RepID=UPI00371E4CF8